jgi:hypothetical protein
MRKKASVPFFNLRSGLDPIGALSPSLSHTNHGDIRHRAPRTGLPLQTADGARRIHGRVFDGLRGRDPRVENLDNVDIHRDRVRQKDLPDRF